MNGQRRHIALLLVIVGSLAAVWSLPPVLQDPSYHAFADQRAVFDMRNFFDVATNLPFLVVGIAGLRHCMYGQVMGARRSWSVFFAGVALVGIGSAYYHADPTDRTLVWDRLPMTAGFMGVLAAVLAERISEQTETYALLPAVLAGMFSVLWWSQTGDLRPYAWVQLLPLIVIPMTLLLYPERQSRDLYIVLSLLCYMLAKVAEHFDTYLYGVTGQTISGHSLKHLAAAAGCAVLLVMVKRRGQAVLGKKADQQMVMAAEAAERYTAGGKGMRQRPI